MARPCVYPRTQDSGVIGRVVGQDQEGETHHIHLPGMIPGCFALL